MIRVGRSGWGWERITQLAQSCILLSSRQTKSKEIEQPGGSGMRKENGLNCSIYKFWPNSTLIKINAYNWSIVSNKTIDDDTVHAGPLLIFQRPKYNKFSPVPQKHVYCLAPKRTLTEISGWALSREPHWGRTETERSYSPHSFYSFNDLTPGFLIRKAAW